jgi:hypothetical protein
LKPKKLGGKFLGCKNLAFHLTKQTSKVLRT